MHNRTIFNMMKKYVLIILLVVGFAFLFHNYVFARVTVTGPSMQPTFNNKDVIFVEKISTKIGNINRGEIIIFDSNNENNDIYIKRVIGVAGDKINIKDGKVYLNGQILMESYLPQGTITKANSSTTEYVVPKGYIFVLGDNRGNSTDSRMLGLINIKDVKGHVILRVYPFENISTF